MTVARFDAKTRATMADAGIWQQGDGTLIEIADMVDDHLVNALLKALAEGESTKITGPLTAEIIQRDLQNYALMVAGRRR